MKKTLTLLALILVAHGGFTQNRALHFDGVDDYIRVPGTAKLNGPATITLETWLFVTDFSSSPCANCAPIIWNQQNSYRFGTGNTQRVYVNLLNGSAQVTLTSVGTISALFWHHIAATFNGTKLKLYIDGNLTDSSTTGSFAITYPSTTSDVWIADPQTGYGGVLEETRIWNYERSAAQIKEGTYKRYPANQKGLLLQYSYEDGVPYKNNAGTDTIADKTSFDHYGVAGNFAMRDSASNFVGGLDFCDTAVYSKFSVSRCVKYQLPSKKRTVLVSGVYQDTILSYQNCDSIMTITVSIFKPSVVSVTLADCDSVQNPVTKGYYKNSGKYITTIKNNAGCDSVISYYVTVYRKDTTYLSFDACNSFKLKNGQTVTSSGVYYDAYKGYRGCDSTVVNTVNIRKNTFAKSTLYMCLFLICPTNPTLIFSKPGVYYDTIQNKIKCDSIIEYTILSDATYGTINAVSCGTYKSPSNKYTWTASGLYYDTLFMGNKRNCDSFITVNLTITAPAKEFLNVTECRRYKVPSGTKTVTTSGTITDVLKSKNGCDSIQYTINVTINNANTAFTRTGNTLTASTTVSGAMFQWYDCTTGFSAISGQTQKSYTPAKAGKYALSVTENTCTDTSNCINFLLGAINPLRLNTISIYPIPSKGGFEIESNIALHDVKITIINALGETIKVWEMDELTRANFQVNLPAALNLIRIESKEGYMIKYVMFE